MLPGRAGMRDSVPSARRSRAAALPRQQSISARWDREPLPTGGAWGGTRQLAGMATATKGEMPCPPPPPQTSCQHWARGMLHLTLRKMHRGDFLLRRQAGAGWATPPPTPLKTL